MVYRNYIMINGFTINYKNIYLGVFNTEEQAINARKDYVQKNNLVGFYNE